MVEEIPKEILKQYLVSNTEDGSIAGDGGIDTVYIQGLANALCCIVLCCVAEDAVFIRSVANALLPLISWGLPLH